MSLLVLLERYQHDGSNLSYWWNRLYTCSNKCIWYHNFSYCLFQQQDNSLIDNLIINGQDIQFRTSSKSSGYQTVDRYKTVYSGLDNGPTFEQVDTSSSDTPYTLLDDYEKHLR